MRAITDIVFGSKLLQQSFGSQMPLFLGFALEIGPFVFWLAEGIRYELGKADKFIPVVLHILVVARVSCFQVWSN